MTTPSPNGPDEARVRLPAGEDAEARAARLEIAWRIAREALEADRQAVELDARFAFGIHNTR